MCIFFIRKRKIYGMLRKNRQIRNLNMEEQGA